MGYKIHYSYTLLGQAEKIVNPMKDVSLLHDALKLHREKILELLSLVRKMDMICNTCKLFQFS